MKKNPNQISLEDIFFMVDHVDDDDDIVFAIYYQGNPIDLTVSAGILYSTGSEALDCIKEAVARMVK